MKNMIIPVLIAGCLIGSALVDPSATAVQAAESSDATAEAGVGEPVSPSEESLVAEESDPAEDDAVAAAPPREARRAAARRNVLLASLTIFVLAVFVGFEVITKVPPTLHTPLMSGSNAISGITIVGALIIAGDAGGMAALLGFLAVVLAMVNVVGGFLVTHRMLAMFKKR